MSRPDANEDPFFGRLNYRLPIRNLQPTNAASTNLNSVRGHMASDFQLVIMGYSGLSDVGENGP